MKKDKGIWIAKAKPSTTGQTLASGWHILVRENRGWN
jgi:hypothetical protein